MLKLLLKIRLKALADSMFNRHRRGKSGGKGMKALLIFLLIYCVAAFGGMFGLMFYSMYEPFQMLEMGWLYYSLCGVMATMLCFVGSVFFTQSTLYDAKDNELLLSMPIPSSVILGSRMALLLLLNYAYSLLMTATCGVVRCIVAPVTVLGVARYVAAALLLPLIPTTLSCIVGYLIALVISRVRNKSLVSMVLSLIFLGAYFAVCFNMQSYIERMVQNGAAIGAAIQKALPPFYALGLALDQGDWLQLLRFALWCVVPFAAVYYLLSRSFIRLATAKKGLKKVKYQAGRLQASSVRWALTRKELLHLGNSSAYMLNGCLGAILAVAMSVLVAVKGESILQGLADIYAGGFDIHAYIMPFACVIECLTLSMTIISAPSISLEGKNLWMLQSAPVKAGDVLLGKALAHMLVAGPAALLSSLLLSLTLPMSAAEIALLFALPLTLTVFMAFLGVTVNLRWPRFDYTNETYVIKQSASVTITMFSGMGLVILPCLLYVLLLRKVLLPADMLLIATVVLAIADFVLYHYLTHGAQKAFANLNQD